MVEMVFLAALSTVTVSTPAALPPERVVVAPRAPVPMPLLRELMMEDARRLAGEGPEPVTLGAGFPVASWPRLPKSTSTRGLRIQGIDITSGLDTDHEAEDPFISPGVDRLLDWDVKMKIRQGDMGFKATYRNPTFLERLTVSFKKEMDSFEEFGVGGLRDKVMSWFGRDEQEEERDGYKIDTSAVLDEYWGFSFSYGESERTRPDAWTFRRTESGSVGYTPLGRNEGKPWNYSVFAAVNHQDEDSTGLGAKGRRSGFGYSAGAAFQHALDQVDFPIIGVGNKDGFSFKHVRATLSCSDSEISDLSVRAAVELTCRVTRHLRLSSGLEATWLPDLRDFDFGHTFGMGVHW